jgi:hypothetical protein
MQFDRARPSQTDGLFSPKPMTSFLLKISKIGRSILIVVEAAQTRGSFPLRINVRRRLRGTTLAWRASSRQRASATWMPVLFIANVIAVACSQICQEDRLAPIVAETTEKILCRFFL